MKRILENKDGTYRDHHEKVPLATVLPLSTPYLVYLDPSSVCNIRCNFCFHSLDAAGLREAGFRPGIMEYDLYTEVIDQFGEFPEQVKSFKFGGLGEPLLNKRLPEMIRYARDAGIARRLVLVTNGTLLEPDLNRRLIDGGLDDVVISAEGVSRAKYAEIAGVELDFDRLLENIADLHAHRRDCRIYVKVAHTGLDERGEAGFHALFDEICDTAYVEYLSRIYQGVEYDSIIEDPTINQVGERLDKPVQVCFLPFLNLTINVFGQVSPCIFDYKERLVIGNVRETRLVELWNCRKMNAFRVMHLRKRRHAHRDCGCCDWLSICGCRIYENIIDDDAEDLLEHYEEPP